MLTRILSESTGLPEATFTDDFDLRDCAELDSLTTLEMFMQIEDAYGVNTRNGPNLRTVGELRSWLEGRDND